MKTKAWFSLEISTTLTLWIVCLLALGLAAFSVYVAVQPAGEARGVTPRYYGSFVANSSSNYVKLWSGADLTVYSDKDSTAVFSVDGATGNVVVAGTISGAAGSGTNATYTGTITANAAVITTSVAAASVAIGGGYGSTGCAVSATGALSCDGAMIGDSSLTANSAIITTSATFGGGYGSTGCTISTAGVLQCDGAATLGGTTTINDNVIVTGTGDFGGNIILQNDETIGNAVNGTIALGGAVDVTGASLQYGPNNLYPLGVDTSGFEIEWGVSDITGTLAVNHGLTGPVMAYCTMGEAPTVGAGDGYMCSAGISGATVTIYVWQDDATAATEASVAVYWIVVGTP